MISEAIGRLANGNNLTEEQSQSVLTYIMEGKAGDAQIGAVLALLKRKGETADEVTGFVKAMRGKAVQVPFQGAAMDLCGTGGDGKGTANISTAVTFVVGACGVTVAKHGNRAATSSCGGADVLEQLGLKLEASPRKLAKALEEVGACFLFARSIHPAMRYVAKARRELGIRTVFNMLGPLTNPVSPRYQLLGVFSPGVAPLMARALRRVGCEDAWLVHGAGGLDEVSPAGPTHVWSVEEDGFSEFDIRPADFGLQEASISDIKGGDPEYNASVLRGVLQGKEGPVLDTVLMNSACALLIAGKASDLKEGVSVARSAIEAGEALGMLERMIEFMGQESDVLR